jgi:hypothetical protein
MSQASTATEIDSVSESEQGPSTGKDVTRRVSAQDLINLGRQEVIDAGKRPSYQHRLIRNAELTRPPLMYQSANVTKLEGFEEHGATLAPAVTALEAMEKCISEVIDARNRSAKDPALTEGAAVLKVAAYGDKLSEAASKKADVAHRHVESQIAAVEADLTKAVTANIHTALAGEIRSHSKGEKNPVQFVSGLIAAGDEQSVNAILGAPAYLSGLTDDMRAALTKQWNAKRNPALTARLELLKATDDRLSRASSGFILTIEKAMGVDYRVIQKLRAAQAAASFG